MNHTSPSPQYQSQLTRLALDPDHDDPAYGPDPEEQLAALGPLPDGAELVFCRTCDTPHHLTTYTIICPVCQEEILSRRALLNLIEDKQNQVNTLLAEIGAARIEQYQRKLRNGERFFWEQPKPALTRPPAKSTRPTGLAGLPDLDLDEFED